MSQCSGESSRLASEILWNAATSAGGEKPLIILILGMVICFGTVVFYFVHIARHNVQGRRMIKENYVGTSFLPMKLRNQTDILMLGPVVAIFSLVSLCVPELTTMSELMQAIYRSVALYRIVWYCVIEFRGGAGNLVRADGTGTFQQHAPRRLWAQAPLCCVWVFCLPFMKKRITVRRDLLFIMYLTSQYCIFGPLAATLQVVLYYEGVSASSRRPLNLSCVVVGILSNLGAIWAARVIGAMVQSLEPVPHQLAQRSWCHKERDECLKEVKKEEIEGDKKVGYKVRWVIIVSTLPNIAFLIISFSVQGGECFDTGEALPQIDLENFYGAFAGLIIGLLGVVIAMKKGFPVQSEEDAKVEFVSQVSGRILEAEIQPTFVLRMMRDSIDRLIEQRTSAGLKGFDKEAPLKWREFFGAQALTEAAPSSGDPDVHGQRQLAQGDGEAEA